MNFFSNLPSEYLTLGLVPDSFSLTDCNSYRKNILAKNEYNKDTMTISLVETLFSSKKNGKFAPGY